MVQIAAFKPLRFSSDPLEQVVAPPYDVIDAEQRRELVARSPHNIVQLDLPEGEGDAKYKHAADLFNQWIAEGVLERADAPLLLRYEQDFEPPDGGGVITRRGFFALVRVSPYEEGAVLPHERTLSGPKEDRYKLMVTTRAALSPVFLLYSDPSRAAARALDQGDSLTAFETPDGIKHRLGVVRDPVAITTVIEALRERPALIADGHHRYETALRYRDQVERELVAGGGTSSPKGAHQYVMAFLADADDPGLMVFPTHRLVHGISGFDRGTMLERAAGLFEVTPLPTTEALAALAQAGHRAPSIAAVFPDGEAALFALREDADLASHPVLGRVSTVLRDLDVVLLHGAILEHVLGITVEKQRSQSNLRYVKSTTEALARIQSGEGDVLFLMNATPVDAVRRVCESGEVMPQKSTFFYPKVPTGLAIHQLDPEEVIGG